MSDAIVEEFERELASLAREHEGDPNAELEALWVLGIEREAIVTVAYRRAVIEDRLARMPIDDEMRRVVARAVRWAWRDEQAHTLWVRGALLRRSERSLRLRALLAQLEGWVGGWVSSRQNHLAWTEAPLSRLVAEGLEAAGVLSGRIPPAVRAELHWNTFADFCRFNRAAEKTAALAWARMTALATELGAHDDAEGFARMRDDEERHASIFAALAASFDEHDHALEGVDALRASLQRVGQRFVAVPDQAGTAWRNPLGKGGEVVVREGEDIDRLASEVFEKIGVAALLRAHAHPVVALKTTFMLVADRRDPSPGVSMHVLRAVTAWLRERGAVVRVIDARNHYDAFHARRTVAEVAAYLGLEESVVDAQTDQIEHDYARGMGVDTVSRTWRDADVRILLGKLRAHPTAIALLSLEGAEGLGARVHDLVFADRRTERETALLMSIDGFPPHAALLDAWENVPDGLLGVMGTEHSLQPRRLYGSTDAVALDAVASRHIGADPAREEMLVAHAFDWFGDPRGATRIDGPDVPIAGFRLPDRSLRTTFLSALARPVYTHASLRGELFLPDFDEDAFPPIAPPSAAVRAVRAGVRRIVDDRRHDDVLLPVTMHDGVRMTRIGSGPPVVLLHGYPETLQVWARVAPKLARGHEVIAFDWPGLGYSRARGGPADPEALAEQLRDLLDEAGLARVDLVAADMGAPPALVFAARHPERTGTVVVLSSLLFGDEATSIEIQIMRRAGLAGAAFSLAPAVVYARCKQTFLPLGETLAPALDRDFSVAFHRPEVRAHLARMCEDYERALPRLPEAYWKIRRPVRLLWAEHDGHFPPSQAERLCALLPEARHTVIAGARHWMALSRPDEVADHITAFLAEEQT